MHHKRNKRIPQHKKITKITKIAKIIKYSTDILRNFEVAKDFFESLGYQVQQVFNDLPSNSGSGVSGGFP
jgi:hypothetical protein